MHHDISCLPGYQNRAAWERSAHAFLTRMLCKASAVDHITPTAILLAMETGDLKISQSDIEDGEQSALLALLARNNISSDDLGTLPASEASPEPLSAAEQSIARRLIEAGCAIDKPLLSLPGQADAMDLCLALNADRVLAENIDRIDWTTRTMLDLPWPHYAARRGMLATLRVLLDKGAPVDGLDRQGNSALFHASDASCVKLLIERGANPTLFNANGETPSAYWEARRKIKGERLAQLRTALPRQQNLSPEQQFDQLLKTIPTTTKSRLEKEVRRLRLTGKERQEGVGVLRGVLDRCRQTMSTRGQGASEQQCASLLDFTCSWSTLIEHATTAELCDLVIMTATWELASFEHISKALTGKLPESVDQAKALSLSAARWLEVDFVSRRHREELAKWVLQQEDLGLFGPLVLKVITSMHHKDDNYHQSLLSEWEDRWMKAPDHPFWKKTATVDSLLKLATSLAYEGVDKMEQFHRVASRLADHAVMQGALPSASAMTAAKNFAKLIPIQRAWLDGFQAQVEAMTLQKTTQSTQPSRRGPRL